MSPPSRQAKGQRNWNLGVRCARLPVYTPPRGGGWVFKGRGWHGSCNNNARLVPYHHLRCSFAIVACFLQCSSLFSPSWVFFLSLPGLGGAQGCQTTRRAESADEFFCSLGELNRCRRIAPISGQSIPGQHKDERTCEHDFLRKRLRQTFGEHTLPKASEFESHGVAQPSARQGLSADFA